MIHPRYENNADNSFVLPDDAAQNVEAGSDTKSGIRAEARNSEDALEDMVVIYNRVPKTASTSFVGLVYDLCKQNKYHVLHINVTNNMHTLTLTNQVLHICSYTYIQKIHMIFKSRFSEYYNLI